MRGRQAAVGAVDGSANSDRPNDFAQRMRRHLADAEGTRRSLAVRWQAAWNALEQRLRANHHLGGRGRFNVQTEFDAVVDAQPADYFAVAVDAGRRSLPAVFPIFNDFAGGAPETSCADFDAAAIAGDRPRAAKALFRVSSASAIIRRTASSCRLAAIAPC